MGARERGAAALALVVAGALIGGLAWNLSHTQAESRHSLRDELGRRAGLTGKLIGAAFASSNSAEERAKFSGPRNSLAAAVKSASATSTRVVVLDSRGAVLAAQPPALAHESNLLQQSWHLRAALAGHVALSDVFRDQTGHLALELAIPVQAGGERRVVAGAGPVEIVQRFTDGFFTSASAIQGTRGYLVDGANRTLSTTGTRAVIGQTPPERQLVSALQRRPQGTYQDRTFVSAAVPGSRWRVVLSVPSARLYAPVEGGAHRAAWLLLAAFSAAICGLLALGTATARAAKRATTAAERERAATELAHERLHDTLTGLPNRGLLEDRAEHALSAAARTGMSVALMFMDVDDFKRVNDSLGHGAGDTALCEIARRLERSVRPEDTLSRYASDAYVVLCDQIDPGDVLPLAVRVQDAVREPIVVDGRPLTLTVSIGVAVHDGSGTPNAMLRDAEAAMFRAKRLGRGRVELVDRDLQRQAITRLDAELALRRAIDEQELLVHYQPIVSLPEGTIRGVEALVRWRPADTGELVPPDQFIPLAEETGLISEIGEWVLRTAVREVGDWSSRRLIDDDFQLSVNVSAHQLSDPDLPSTVADALSCWDRAPSCLWLEITESAVMRDPRLAEQTLWSLHSLGVSLALDDFGVGHSSLGQLARALPISVLKLDRSFVAGMNAPRDRGIIEAAAALARALDLVSVAEGVEHPEQARELAAVGFPLAQGFHFGRPAPGDQILTLLGHPASYTPAAQR
jgi:diguanylate cyclase (GGDEF)-like protein